MDCLLGNYLGLSKLFHSDIFVPHDLLVSKISIRATKRRCLGTGTLRLIEQAANMPDVMSIARSTIIHHLHEFSMSHSFSAAARRLRNDARSLEESSRCQTAGHLIGLAAECCVKAVVERAGIAIDSATGYKTHFPELGHRLRILGRTRHMYPLLLVISSSEFLEGWSVESRYADDQPEGSARTDCQRWADQTDHLLIMSGLMS
jgi:hypothetical protein